MKKAILATCICIMFLILMLTGCESSGPNTADNGLYTPNYIKVTVGVRVQAVHVEYDEYAVKDGEKVEWHREVLSSGPLTGITIKIIIEKAGGENSIFYRTTDSSGFTEIGEATFNVYKEQPVTVFAEITVQRNHPHFDYFWGWEEYTWEQIWEAAGGFGKSCAFTSMLTVKEEELLIWHDLTS